MNKDLTYLMLIVDASGSMNNIKEDAEGGVNSLIEKQAKEEGTCIVTLVDFASQGDYNVVIDGIEASKVKPYSLIPRGMTALTDAVGRSINEMGDRLSKMDEKDRPGLVTVAIITDGFENSSREFNKKQVTDMIEKQENEFSWQFTFLGADQDAFAEAGSLGIKKTSATNFSKDKIFHACESVGQNVSRMRCQTRSGVEVKSFYTPEEVSKHS